MPDMNYVVVTAAECPVEKRAMAVEKMSGFADDLKSQAGTIHTRFGILMTGSNPGSLIFVQSYESLSGFEKAQEVYANSAPYNDLIKQSGVKILLRNIAKLVPVEFPQKMDSNPKYLVLTRATPTGYTPAEIVSEFSKISNLFADNGASTLRFGRILTGSNAGDMLLGVTYPSMAEIEASYDAVASSETFMKLASNISINLRNIIRIY